MRDIRDWTRDDLESLVRTSAQESTDLEFKRSASLAKSSPVELQPSKDVSAFANSAGGTIVYGIIEKKEDGIPVASALDEGVDARDITAEWLEQKLNSIIHPRSKD